MTEKLLLKGERCIWHVTKGWTSTGHPLYLHQNEQTKHSKQLSDPLFSRKSYQLYFVQGTLAIWLFFLQISTSAWVETWTIFKSLCAGPVNFTVSPFVTGNFVFCTYCLDSRLVNLFCHCVYTSICTCKFSILIIIKLWSANSYLIRNKFKWKYITPLKHFRCDCHCCFSKFQVYDTTSARISSIFWFKMRDPYQKFETCHRNRIVFC